jgi:pSer/pThr/pTyr-binding forkhead associated (FHA) protein
MDRFFKLKGESPDSGTRSTEALAELEVADIGTFSIQHLATIGRDPACDVVLAAPSVSRRHARIFYEGGHFWIKDLDSANGSQINGKKLKLQMLSDGDKISFGEVKAVFRAKARTPGPAPLGEDPLAGTELLPEDGTPTGGFCAPSSTSLSPQDQRIKEQESTIEKLRQEVAGNESKLTKLNQKLEALQAENDTLRKEMTQSRGFSTTMGTAAGAPLVSDSLLVENQRLQRLVNQLERALADSNLRLRNLQERLDRTK